MTQFPASMTADGSAGEMVKLVTEIARCLVDSPERVLVEAVEDHDSTILRLHVAEGDVGKVIGRQGRTARSLRTILSAASRKLKHRFALDILEEADHGAKAETV